VSTVTIYGASDDLVEVDGDVPGCDEYGTDIATFKVTGQDDRVTRVGITYTANGCWSIAAAPWDEDVPMVPATITDDYERREHGPHYTAVMTFNNVERVEFVS
jgi:hypothetical protein